MQSSSLAGSFASSGRDALSPRLNGASIRLGAGGDAFRQRLELLANRNNAGGSVERGPMLPQDERTIRTPTHAPHEGAESSMGPHHHGPTKRVEKVDGSQRAEVENKPESKRAKDAKPEPVEKSDDQPADSATKSGSKEKLKTQSVKDEGEEVASTAVPLIQVPADAQSAAEESAAKDAAGETAVPVDATAQASDPALQLDAAQQVALKAENTPASTADDAGAGGASEAAKPKPVAKVDLTGMDDASADVPAKPEHKVEATPKQQDGEQNNADVLAQPGDKPVAETKPAAEKTTATFDRQLDALQTDIGRTTRSDDVGSAKLAPQPNLSPEQKFVQDNVDQVVKSVRTQSMQGGGQMNVRLDPPELGALQVAVKMIEGRLTASFTTSNEQATQLLSHSLQHLKLSLEASGVNVDRIEVRQAPQSESSNNKSQGDSQQQQRGFDAHSQQSEQQRKEMVRRMWRKLAFGSDDLDLVA